MPIYVINGVDVGISGTITLPLDDQFVKRLESGYRTPSSGLEAL